jgi:membrane protein insertase Oxa1/YidC/SpoIIIJ
MLSLRVGRSTASVTRRSFSTRTVGTQAPLIEQVTAQANAWGIDPTSAYDPSLPVEGFQRLAVNIHDSLGVEWGTALGLMALGFRWVTFPLYAGSVAVGRRRAAAAKELTELRDMAKEAVLLKDQKLVNDIDREYKHRMKSMGLTGNPLQGLGYTFFAQMPWATIMLFSLRGMSTQPNLFPSFALDSQFLWCESLALADPYGILPLLSTMAVALSAGKSQTAVKPGEPSISARDQKYVMYAIRGASFTFLPFAMQLPAGVLIFFLVNNLFNRITTPMITKYLCKKV